MKDYQKVILLLYPKMGRLIEDIGQIVEAKARASYNGAECAERCVKKLLDYIYVRDELFFLKQQTDEIVESLGREERYLLEYKYFRRKRVLEGEFSDFCLNTSERTYFRRQQRLAARFNAALVARGLDEAWFLRTFGKVPYIMAALEKVRGGAGMFLDKRTRGELRVHQ